MSYHDDGSSYTRGAGAIAAFDRGGRGGHGGAAHVGLRRRSGLGALISGSTFKVATSTQQTAPMPTTLSPTESTTIKEETFALPGDLPPNTPVVPTKEGPVAIVEVPPEPVKVIGINEPYPEPGTPTPVPEPLEPTPPIETFKTGSCPAGEVYTKYGCVKPTTAIAPCPPGQIHSHGTYGKCVPGVPTPTVPSPVPPPTQLSPAKIELKAALSTLEYGESTIQLIESGKLTFAQLSTQDLQTMVSAMKKYVAAGGSSDAIIYISGAEEELKKRGQKKGPNFLLIGGIALGALLLVKAVSE